MVGPKENNLSGIDPKTGAWNIKNSSSLLMSSVLTLSP